MRILQLIIPILILIGVIVGYIFAMIHADKSDIIFIFAMTFGALALISVLLLIIVEIIEEL